MTAMPQQPTNPAFPTDATGQPGTVVFGSRHDSSIPRNRSPWPRTVSIEQALQEIAAVQRAVA